MNKYIIITGSSGDLGFSITKEILNKKSYSVIAINRSYNKNIISLKKTYKKRFIFLPFDIKNFSKLEDMYKKKIKPIGEVVGLINNAAVAYDDLITNANYKRLEEMFYINVFSPILLSKLVIRNMLLNKNHGSIVHISSIAASTGYKGLSMYGSTKGALESFSIGLSREWGRKGIRSNCISPGFIKTNMSKSLNKDQINKIIKRSSLKKLITTSEVAKIASFLISDESSSITGTVIRSDAGSL